MSLRDGGIDVNVLSERECETPWKDFTAGDSTNKSREVCMDPDSSVNCL